MGVYRPAIRRATVDLPEPDSPTSPNTSPSLIDRLTCLTASSVRRLRARKALRSTKRMPRSSTSTSGPAARRANSRRWPSQWVAMSSSTVGRLTSSI
ncbi:Uncharacterised protein [Bordetella pertussis]|nr:Uncharacterised protein [Bordetella pertussis]CFW49407.1 Uncharacterised protein [Bordetella pertussis]